MLSVLLWGYEVGYPAGRNIEILPPAFWLSRSWRMIDDGLDEVRVSLNGSFGVLYPMGDIHTHMRDQQLPIKELN